MPLTLDIAPSIADRIAFVTGGCSGIGRASVNALLAHGAVLDASMGPGVRPELMTERGGH